MKNKLIEILESFGYDVSLQDSGTTKNYPESYIKFLVVDTPTAAEFDNQTALTRWRFQVTFYSSNPALIDTVPNQIRTVLKANGFQPIGKGRDLLCSEPDYTGWTTDYYYLEKEGVFNE